MKPDNAQKTWIDETITRLQKAQDKRAEGLLDGRASLTQVRLHKALLEAGVGKRHAYRLAHGPELEVTSALKAVRAFAKDTTLWCLVLAGSRGVGKTLASEWLLAQSLAATATNRARPRHIFSSLQVMKARHEDRLQQNMSTASPLLLDDLGVEVPDRAGGFMWCLFEIINQRWANAAKTVISTNLSPGALHERYGKRVTDRLADGGRCVVVKGPSLRLSRL